MSVELEERIEWQTWMPVRCVEDLAGNAREDLLHHTIRAVVAILERLAEQEAVGIHQAVIDPPGIDADAVERSCTWLCFPQSCRGYRPTSARIFQKRCPCSITGRLGKR